MIVQCCVLLVLGCTSIAIADEEVLSFDQWLDKYGYTSESVDYVTWKANMEYVVAHNQQHSSFKVTLNKFAHLTPKDLVDGYKVRSHYDTEDSLAVVSDPLPDAVDWRTKGVVTAVRDQGQKGYAVLYTAADAVSSFVAIHIGTLATGSVQELTDCCHYPPCTGRFPENVYQCVHDIGGLCSNDTYQNVAQCACGNSTCTPFGTVQGGKTVPEDDETALAAALAMQPVQVAVNANLKSFQLYKVGIYNDPDCSSTGLDHSMLLVGYGSSDKGMPYWILKNSWGVDWGMDGYMYMARGENVCGVATDANYPY